MLNAYVYMYFLWLASTHPMYLLMRSWWRRSLLERFSRLCLLPTVICVEFVYAACMLAFGTRDEIIAKVEEYLGLMCYDVDFDGVVRWIRTGPRPAWLIAYARGGRWPTV